MTEEKNSLLVKPTLGLLGATVNAMALIAPGAFLWISYRLQAAATTPGGASAASGIWMGIILALVVAFSLPCYTHSWQRSIRKQGSRAVPILQRRRGLMPKAKREAARIRWRDQAHNDHSAGY